MGKIIVALLFTIVCLCISINSLENMRHQIVTLQLDRDELKQHTDQLAKIVVTQQYQIDTLVGMLEN